jgi:hypothetical protein
MYNMRRKKACLFSIQEISYDLDSASDSRLILVLCIPRACLFFCLFSKHQSSVLEFTISCFSLWPIFADYSLSHSSFYIKSFTFSFSRGRANKFFIRKCSIIGLLQFRSQELNWCKSTSYIFIR